MKRWVSVLQSVCFFAALAWLGTYCLEHWQALRATPVEIRWSWMALAGALGVVWWMVQAQLWRWLLARLDVTVALGEAFAHVWIANLGKYVPGKVWAAVSRVALCRTSGVPMATAVGALWLENVCFILAGALVALLALPLARFDSGRFVEVALGIVVLVGLIAAHPRIWGGLACRLSRHRTPIPAPTSYRQSLAFVAAYVGSWAVWLGAVVALVLALVPTTPTAALGVAAAAIIAWALGYVAPWAPAGLGVREGVLAALLAGRFAPELVFQLIAGLRLFQTALDLGAAAVAGYSWRLDSSGVLGAGLPQPRHQTHVDE